MAQEFVCYSPDIERDDPNFDRALQTVLEGTRRYVTESVASEGRAVRDAHAQGHGLAKGEVEILGGLPKAYAQGIYAKAARHEALVRFSNGTARLGPDAWLGTASGIGLKIFGIDEPTLLEDEPDGRTFDYVMINGPVFFVNTVEHYIFLQKLFFQLGSAPPLNETSEQKKARFHKFLYEWVTGMGTLAPEDWAWAELGAFLRLSQTEPGNLLLYTYYTMNAVRHGAHVAKVRVAPAQEHADLVVRRNLDLDSDRRAFRHALVAELKERPYEFDIQIQLCTDLMQMPIEDTTVEWREALSPFVTVAKLRLPKQDIGADDNLERMDAVSFSPWRVTENHRPLGSLHRARKEAYRQSSLLRHQLNHQVRKEPKNLGEVFGPQLATTE